MHTLEEIMHARFYQVHLYNTPDPNERILMILNVLINSQILSPEKTSCKPSYFFNEKGVLAPINILVLYSIKFSNF